MATGIPDSALLRAVAEDVPDMALSVRNHLREIADMLDGKAGSPPTHYDAMRDKFGLDDESSMLTNPMFSDADKLEYARGAIKFRNDVIANLRTRLAALTTQAPAEPAAQRIDNWPQLRDYSRVLVLLKEAQESVCSLLCPSTWPTGKRPPHSELCQQITAALTTQAPAAQAELPEPFAELQESGWWHRPLAQGWSGGTFVYSADQMRAALATPAERCGHGVRWENSCGECAAPTPVEPAEPRNFDSLLEDVIFKGLCDWHEAGGFPGDPEEVARLAMNLRCIIVEELPPFAAPVEPGNPATPSVHPSSTLRQEAEPADGARSVLAELYALVKGECPSLLNEDSGGDARLDMRICDILAGSADGDHAKGLT